MVHCLILMKVIMAGVFYRVEEMAADRNTAVLLGLAQDAVIYHSILLHNENGKPLQYEERYVNPQFGPDYLAQDFTVIFTVIVIVFDFIAKRNPYLDHSVYSYSFHDPSFNLEGPAL